MPCVCKCDERWQRTLKREYENDRYVKSPLIMGKFPDFYSYCLLRDLMVISTKDAVFFLDDWRESPGARTEHQFAEAAGKRMFFADRCDACEYFSSGCIVKPKQGTRLLNMRRFRTVTTSRSHISKHLHEAWRPIAGKEGEV